MIDDITVIIITYQEEKNIEECINSVKEVTNNIFVVDSYSTDNTQNILKRMNIEYCEHEFISYADKRNWSQENNPFKTKWVFHIDADERFTPELVHWLLNEFPKAKNNADGFMFSRRTIFLGRWIKHGGHYPSFHLRLYKTSHGKCEEKAYDNHFIINGKKKEIHNIDIIDTVTENISDFIEAHNKWASKEAAGIMSTDNKGDISPKLVGNAIERRRWLKSNIFERLPLFSRSFLYFFYRYIIRLGFLDGKEGLIFHVLQGFWFRFLVDAKVYELKKIGRKK